MTQVSESSSSITRTFAGVDTHKDEHTYAVVTPESEVIDTHSFPATFKGYLEAVAWVKSFGEVQAWGVESVGTYGAGLVGILRGTNDVIKPIKYPTAILKGTTSKTDTHDAISAARAVASNSPIVLGTLKTPIDGVESLSWALSEREHYVKTAKDAVTRLKSLLVTAPVELRDSLKELKTRAMLNKVASWRPGTLDNPVDSFKHRARSLARSALDAYEESARIMKELDGIVLTLCPSLRGITGIGPWGAAIILTSIGWQGPEFVPSEANLASFSGTAPIPASSGKTDRHRLNRGGNRQLNSVLYTAVLSQMRFDPEVKAWIEAKQSQPGKTKKDAIRASKRHLVRVVRRALLNPTGDLIIAT